jgi:hypothetical protein
MTHMNTIQKGSTTAALRAFAVIVGLSLLVMVMTAWYDDGLRWGLEAAQRLERLRETLRKGHLSVPVSEPQAAPSMMQRGKWMHPYS